MSQKFTNRYYTLAHAVQSAIASCMAIGWTGAEPKHLRVGIDTMKSDQGALTKLLLDKGVITEDELESYLLEGLENEIKSYEATFHGLTGTEATFL
jgi:hypothetical protein